MDLKINFRIQFCSRYAYRGAVRPNITKKTFCAAETRSPPALLPEHWPGIYWGGEVSRSGVAWS